MADFFDQEAVVSEGSEDEEVRDEIQRHKKTKNKRAIDSDEEEEEEDDEAAIAEEMKDLINDDVEEEVSEDSEDDIGHHGHKRSREDELEEDLEDDDYDLIEENLGRRIDRKKKFRRIRRLEDDDEDEEEDRNNTINDREAIANELFDDDDYESPNRPTPTPHRDRIDRQAIDERFAEIDSEHSEDEDDNFIVDDNDRPIVNRTRTKKSERFTDQALQQAQDVFGVDFDYDEVANYDENVDLDEENEEEYGEEGEGGVSRKKKKRRPARKSIFELYEPAELERSHLTSFDNDIRDNDLPERFQLRSIPMASISEEEIRLEAAWIYKNVYSVDMISRQEKLNPSGRGPFGGRKPESVTADIQEILHLLHNDLLEVPFIAFYRKEYYMPEMNVNDLWIIYRWDEKWGQLQERKRNLLKLLENMQNYQLSLIMQNHDQPLPENFRRIAEKDLKRVEAIESFEEFNDCYLNFQLYYSSDVIEMKKFMIEQKRQEKARRKLLRNTVEGDSGEKIDDLEEEEDNDGLELTERMGFLKLSMKRDTYAMCREFGIGRFAAKFGLTPEQFGEQISEGYHKHEVEQHEFDPLEAAREHISKRFDTPEKVLEAATFMVGRQLSCDPAVRKTVRQVFYERAKVNAKPTKKGKKEIDESHYCYAIKYLKNKPISSFVNEQFLLLQNAKNEGLLEITISIDEESRPNNSYFDEIKFLYHRDEFSNNVQNWNAQRSQALEIALKRFLYPYFIKELTTRVLNEAQFSILQLCGRKLNSYISVAPFAFNAEECRADDDEDFDTRDGLRIMGFAFTHDNEEASYAALIDGGGEVADYIKLGYFMLKRGQGFATEKEKQLRLSDREKFKKFIFQKKPHAIALGCDTIVTRDVMDELISVVKDLHETDQFPLIPVEYVDSELSIVYMNSKRGSTDFPNYPLKLRQAISLARRLQDPLLEYVQLCSADEEILCLKFHPLQEYVPREDLLNVLYSEFVLQVNEVGVDVNRCLVHPHTAPLVQFIGGLGPRKGAYLLRTLKKQQTPCLENRTQLVQNCSIGKTVFINCAGFIKIDTGSLADSGTDTYIEVLDGTRVHPEANEWARKMAIDALDYDPENESNPAQALEEIMDNPDKLRDLDLDEFAKELKRQGLGKKRLLLYDVRNELTERYKDKRRPYVRPTSDEIFAMLSGETEETLYNGKLLLVRIAGILRRRPKSDQVDRAQPIRTETGSWKCPFCLEDDFTELAHVWNHFDSNQCPGQAFGVRARLDNGLNGLIPIKYLSDKEVADPMTRVKPGMSVHCRVLKVITDRFTVELTCRSSDLIDQHNRFKKPKDNNYDFDAEQKDIWAIEDAKKRNSRQRQYMKRIIVHPSFHNIDFRNAEKMLNSLDQGEAVIRPSSKGNDHLTLSWKVYDGIHMHVDIREENKSNVFSLGRQLYIGNENFEDLDEIIARYVQPMAAHSREITSYKYFRDLNGDRSAAERVLNEEKQKAPSRIPYIISASKEFPGKFLLSYLPNAHPFHEFISITPDGFRYRSNFFKSLNSLFKWFKTHFNDRSTFPRTPNLSTPVSASPYVSQRTPIAQASPFGNTKSGFVPTPNINPQAIQRAAASMPTHIFNALSQVAGQTPSFSAPFGQTPSGSGNNSAATFAVPGRPNLYNANTSRAVMPASSSMPPPPLPPAPSRPGSRSGNQWADIVQQDWQQPNPQSGRVPRVISARTPAYATPGASSAMSISPQQEETPNIRGDQTPLFDEWNAY